MDFTPEPDIHPIHPRPIDVTLLLSTHSSISHEQKSELIGHCLNRACVFGDLSLLSFLLADPHGRHFANLAVQDEDGLNLPSVAILGFGADTERDVEREECVRFLVAEGADVNCGDHAGWTPVHHAALTAPPTLMSFLLTRGADVLAQTHRGLTALDIIRAYSPIPGREDIALLLEEAMREQGWRGNRLDIRRRDIEERAKRLERERRLYLGIASVLDLPQHWWGDGRFDDDFLINTGSEESSDDDTSNSAYDWNSMLVYSPQSLTDILKVLVTEFQPSLRNCDPAKCLYLLCRFACLWGDTDWIEDLIAGAVDKIEENIYAFPEDLPRLTFWLYNCTALLHLLRCDAGIAETVDLLGLFALIEELINAIFVFIIRTAERQIDPFIETSLLDRAQQSAETDGVQFESEWSFFRSLARKRVAASPKPSVHTINAALLNSPNTTPPSQSSSVPSRPDSPSAGYPSSSPAPTGRFSSLRQSMSSLPSQMTPTPTQVLFPDSKSNGVRCTEHDLITYLSAFHAILSLSGINPVLIAQAFSQIMYWTSCELFNRIITRKRYLCRSRAAQISQNIEVIKVWVDGVGLPSGITSHFSPVYDLLCWLQSLSSLDDFAGLVSIIQDLRNLNPFQMRRAVKDYRYEVGEGRMNDECAQYLAQLQKDWERHRVKVGVENMRKDFIDREDDEDSSEQYEDGHLAPEHAKDSSFVSSTPSMLDFEPALQKDVDNLFDPTFDYSQWLPTKPPPVLGELLESRYMLPMILPSDPNMLCALPPDLDILSGQERPTANGRKSQSMPYQLQQGNWKAVTTDTLALIDGVDWQPSLTSILRDDQHDQIDANSLNQGDEESSPRSPQLTDFHILQSHAPRSRNASGASQ